MHSEKCRKCSGYKNCKDSFNSWFFFMIGIIATVAIRLITVLTHISPFSAKISWYVGIIGFIIFFIYKYCLIRARSRKIEKLNIFSRIKKYQPLKETDYNFLTEVLCGLSSKKERINYIFIFGLSILALIIAVYLDFVK